MRPFAYINLGDIYIQQGKVEEALPKFQQEMQVEIALSIAPTWVNECQGMIYLTQGKLNDAGTEFRQVIELDPNNTMVHYNLACVYSLKNELKLAVESLQKAIKLDKSYIELRKLPKNTMGVVIVEIDNDSPINYLNVENIIIEAEGKRIKTVGDLKNIVNAALKKIG